MAERKSIGGKSDEGGHVGRASNTRAKQAAVSELHAYLDDDCERDDGEECYEAPSLPAQVLAELSRQRRQA